MPILPRKLPPLNMSAKCLTFLQCTASLMKTLIPHSVCRKEPVPFHYVVTEVCCRHVGGRQMHAGSILKRSNSTLLNEDLILAKTRDKLEDNMKILNHTYLI